MHSHLNTMAPKTSPHLYKHRSSLHISHFLFCLICEGVNERGFFKKVFTDNTDPTSNTWLDVGVGVGSRSTDAFLLLIRTMTKNGKILLQKKSTFSSERENLFPHYYSDYKKHPFLFSMVFYFFNLFKLKRNWIFSTKVRSGFLAMRSWVHILQQLILFYGKQLPPKT